MHETQTLIEIYWNIQSILNRIKDSVSITRVLWNLALKVIQMYTYIYIFTSVSSFIKQKNWTHTVLHLKKLLPSLCLVVKDGATHRHRQTSYLQHCIAAGGSGFDCCQPADQIVMGMLCHLYISIYIYVSISTHTTQSIVIHLLHSYIMICMCIWKNHQIDLLLILCQIYSIEYPVPWMRLSLRLRLYPLPGQELTTWLDPQGLHC